MTVGSVAEAMRETVLETVPEVGEVMEMVGTVMSGTVERLKVAVTVVAEETVTVQLPVPEHPVPAFAVGLTDQLVKVEPDEGMAVKIIWVPEEMFDWVHVVPQLIEPPETVPKPVDAPLEMVRV